MNPEDVAERLYRAQEFQERKKRFVESMRKMQEEELSKECTFKPEIKSQLGRSMSPSRYMLGVRYISSYIYACVCMSI